MLGGGDWQLGGSGQRGEIDRDSGSGGGEIGSGQRGEIGSGKIASDRSPEFFHSSSSSIKSAI